MDEKEAEARPVMGTIFLVIPLVTNFPGICAFIIGFFFTVWTKKSAKKVRKQVKGCLQNMYQSVAFHSKYVLLVL